MDNILGFFGKYRFLSNFYYSDVELNGVIYPTVENAFQAAKVLDLYKRGDFVSIEPGAAKRAGRFVKLRDDWERVKDIIMEDLVRKKFENNSDLRNKLIATGDSYLEETNTWNDTYWGVCRGNGKNKLGKILMKVREECFNK